MASLVSFHQWVSSQKNSFPVKMGANDLIIGFYDLQKDPDQQQPLENQTLLFQKLTQMKVRCRLLMLH
ncbi:MAG TPA: hypothetical protein DIT94_11710 [Deltaproteobacteria bacterium]|nr:hypothetical protein [Deltaproteobacteria bacterium]